MARIAVLTSGGDAPGMNAAIRAVVRAGVEDGFEGLLGETMARPLDAADVRGLLPRGGTILRTVNKGHFATRTVDGETVNCAVGGVPAATLTVWTVVDWEPRLSVTVSFMAA